jgi:hypothetical protein
LNKMKERVGSNNPNYGGSKGGYWKRRSRKKWI